MQAILKIISNVISVYSTICFVRIIFTWIPQLNYSKPGQILSAICDPYLNLFRKIPFRIAGLDFTPILALGILSLLSSLIQNIANTGRIYIGGIIATVVNLIWSLFSSIAGILFIVLLIRLMVLLFSKKSSYYDSPWSQFDNSISPIVYKLAGPFNKRFQMDYKKALITSLIILGVFLVAGNILLGFLFVFIDKIPF